MLYNLPAVRIYVRHLERRSRCVPFPEWGCSSAWESAAFATRRSRVRFPSSPPIIPRFRLPVPDCKLPHQFLYFTKAVLQSRNHSETIDKLKQSVVSTANLENRQTRNQILSGASECAYSFGGSRSSRKKADNAERPGSPDLK